MGALALINITNGNDRTLSGFSENAREEMLVRGEPTCSSCYWQYIRCRGCPYKDYLMYYEYYQDVSYADRWVRAALDGAPTGFNSSEGDADFTNADDAVRVESAKTGIVAMSVWMYITRKFEEGLDDCDSRCVSCNFNGVHAWDEAVVDGLQRREAVGPQREARPRLRRERLRSLVDLGVDEGVLVEDEELVELVEMELRELLYFYKFPGDDVPVVKGLSLIHI